MTDSATGIPGLIPDRNQNIYAHVSSRKKPAISREYPCSQKHLSKNPPFGIKTVGPICSWQLNNQRAHHKHIRGM